ncbi:MAG: flavin reductase family protein [Pseudomonadota bacterium]
MTELRDQFLNAMSRVAATVTIVTTDGPGGPYGMTVSAMSSVSADTEQPVLMVCVNRKCSAAAPILANRVFGVNILRGEQTGLADIFAGRGAGTAGQDRFASGTWVRGASGAPLLEDALVAFDCRLEREFLVGQHHVLFGAVQDVLPGAGEEPLLYVDRAYARAHRLAAFAASDG